MITLGLDIGSNSVGSAWVDTESKTIDLGVSVFPAGVDETDTKRGAPVNQKRRQKRQQRRSIARRAQRKHRLRRLLTQVGLLPSEPTQLQALLNTNPWELRRKGLADVLTTHEFGRVLLHLAQRRGAIGVTTDPDDEEEGKVKEAIDNLRKQLTDRTFGQFIADLMDERRHAVPGPDGKPKAGKFFFDPVRNRRDKFEFHADRSLVRQEFLALWNKQRSFKSPLAALLTPELLKQFDDPTEDDTFRHKGELFGQRRTYWDSGTLGRCDLEPTDHRCPLADMYAQEFRVIETVNNIRVEERGKSPWPLTPEERAKVITALRKQKTGSVATVRKALGIDKKAVKEFIKLNIERDQDREINTDWFYREIAHGVFTEDLWRNLPPQQRDSVNRAVLNFDPDKPEHKAQLHAGAMKWWGLSAGAADNLIEAWKHRPNPDKRISISRRAVRNLLPYMNQFDGEQDRWPSQSEARQTYSERAIDCDNDPIIRSEDANRRVRYVVTVTSALRRRLLELFGGDIDGVERALRLRRLNHADRHFLKKHPDLLPPAPMLANPVVRKAIHEVRRHIIAYLRKHGRKPDRIVIELTRSAKQSEKVRNNILANNRKREKERREIEEEFRDFVTPTNPMHRIVDRVRLWHEQKFCSAYSNTEICKDRVGKGVDLEIDHIIPLSRSQDNGFNNKVLCLRDENRDKANQTAREWLEKKSQFEQVEQRLGHLEKINPRKWENLHRQAHDPNDPQARAAWANSQLSDTAYAATQVGTYLTECLFGGEKNGKRRVFFTKGSYTAILRRDWQLIDDDGPKNRGDHRHHAVDAVPIAMTDPAIIQDLARHAEEQEKAKASLGKWPERKPLDPPWGSVEDFRTQVLGQVQRLTVAHRPVKRKITGFFHKEDLWGVVDEEQGVFRIRCPIAQLSPKMLRPPVLETDDQVRNRVIDELTKSGLSLKDAKFKARDLMARKEYKPQLVDPSLGKGGLVRDWAIRRIIRNCLKSNNIDPDNFTGKQIVDFAASGKLKMPSGVPIKSVITLGPISDPVKIPVKDRFTGKQAIYPRTGRPLFRYHISRNNHHVEIMEDIKTGKWLLRDGACVTVFQAVKRVRPPKSPDGTRAKALPMVDRSDSDNQRFVMSLSEGETVHMRHPDTGETGYFVVFKLDSTRIWLIHHWDARRSVFEKDGNGKEIPGTKREEIDLAPADLKTFGPTPDTPPYKVRISPLRPPEPLRRD